MKMKRRVKTKKKWKNGRKRGSRKRRLEGNKNVVDAVVV